MITPTEFSHWQSLCDSVTELIVWVTLDGRVLFINRTAREALGEATVARQSLKIEQLLSPGSRAVYSAAHQAVLAGSQRQSLSVAFRRVGQSDVEVQGALLPLDLNGERHIALAVRPTLTVGDTEALTEQLALFRAMVEQSPDAFAVYQDGVLVYANPAGLRLIGATDPLQVLGKTVVTVVHPDDHQLVEERRQAIYATGQPQQTTEIRIVRLDGEVVEVESLSHLTHVNGRMAVAVMLRDIRERNRQAVALRQAHKLESLGLMASGIAHDFNNILTAIQLQATLARNKIPTDHAAQRNLQMTLDAADRAADVIRQMATYAGRSTLRPEPVDMATVCDNTRRLLESAIAKSCEVHWTIAEGLPNVAGDASEIQQILSTLVMNGAEAIGEQPGRVDVDIVTYRVTEADLRTLVEPTISVGDYMCLSVRDNGVGMLPAVVERIFDPFFTTKFPGRGLGLAALLGIVRSHHGAVRVESKPGVGSRFEVFLPVVPAPAPVAAVSRAVSFAPKYVLFVDDEPFLREAVADILPDAVPGVPVLTAADGEQALKLLQAHSTEIALVILDLTIPGTTGEAMFQAIKAINPAIPVVLASGHALEDMQRRFSGQAVAGFLPKPFTPAALSQLVQSILASNA